jgi:hypothetical protein
MRVDVAEDLSTVFIRGTKRSTRLRRTVPIVGETARSLLEYALTHAKGENGVLFRPWNNVRRDLADACCSSDPGIGRIQWTGWTRRACRPERVRAAEKQRSPADVAVCGASDVRACWSAWGRNRTSDTGIFRPRSGVAKAAGSLGTEAAPTGGVAHL